MNPLTSFISTVFRTIFRLSLFALASIFVLALLCVSLAAALVAIIWSLITGRKPAVWTTFTRFQQASRQFRNGVWTGRPAAADTNNSGSAGARAGADVVDVDFKEIPEPPPKKLP